MKATMANKIHTAALTALVYLLASGQAGAACNAVFSAATVQLGQLSAASLKAANVAGYRSMGSKGQVLNVTCDVPQTTFRLQFDGLTPVAGQPLLRWGAVGAMQMRAIGASAAGLPVPMRLEGAAASPYTGSVLLTQNDVLNLDLSHVPLPSRKSFTLELELTGLLPSSYVVRSEVKFDSNIAVQLLGQP